MGDGRKSYRQDLDGEPTALQGTNKEIFKRLNIDPDG